jgi:hypothetical protein
MSIASPCIRNCCLNKQDVCIGCGRTLQEIVRWGEVADKEKLEILMTSRTRKAGRVKSNV